MALDLIFVHVPKAGGTSIRAAMLAKYKDHLLSDYVDRPGDPSSPMNIDPAGFLDRVHNSNFPGLVGKDAIAGHFWIRKYDPVAAHLRATVLRHPIDRACSHYYYWRITPDRRNPVCRYMLEHDLDLAAFCRMPLVRYLYTGLFFREVDMRSFDVITDFNDLHTRWDTWANLLGLDASVPHLRKNEADEYQSFKRELAANHALTGFLTDILKDDIAFYRRWTGRDQSDVLDPA